MLRAAHYKADAVDGPGAGRSPPKHRTGGILDLALTAADKYALSLLPTALKGTGLAGNDGPATDSRAAPQYPSNGIPPAFKMQRHQGNPALHSTPAPPQDAASLQPTVDSRVATSWDTSLKEILAALEPESRTLKPAKLRDHKYPNQNHGMPTNTVIPSPRRELDDALITLPGGTRRNKSTVPAYAAALKGFSRQSRRPDLQTVDVQYDVVPSVKLAWAGPANGTYSTTGFGGSPKKYTSQLVGRVSPHYAGTPGLQQSMSTPNGNQDPLHLPEIPNASSFKTAGTSALPSYQTWAHSATPGAAGSSPANSRRGLPYVSMNAPSLAKPLTAQYHPVLKSSSLSAGPGHVHPQPWGPSPASRGTPQRPATDQGSPPPPQPQQGSGGSPGDAGRLYPRGPYSNQPHRLPQTPPEVAAEVARLRHAQELDGVINGVRSDLMQAAAPRDPPKSKFLQMYEDPNRPLTKLNPKHFLGSVAPPPHHHHRRHRPPNIQADKHQSSADGGPSSTSPSTSGLSPMSERRLRPLPSDAHLAEEPSAAVAGSAPQTGDGAGGVEGDALLNVHLQPPIVPNGAVQDEGSQLDLGGGTASAGRSTPRSSQLEQEDTVLTVADFRALSDSGAAGPAGAEEGEAAVADEGDQSGGAAMEAHNLEGTGAGVAATADGGEGAAAVASVVAEPELGETPGEGAAAEAAQETAATKPVPVPEGTEPAGVDKQDVGLAAQTPESAQQDAQLQPPEVAPPAEAEPVASAQGVTEVSLAELQPAEAPAEAGVSEQMAAAATEAAEQPAASTSGDSAAEDAPPRPALESPADAGPPAPSEAAETPLAAEQPSRPSSRQSGVDVAGIEPEPAPAATAVDSASAGDAATADPAGASAEAADAACGEDTLADAVTSGTPAADGSAQTGEPASEQEAPGADVDGAAGTEPAPLPPADDSGAEPLAGEAEGGAAGSTPPQQQQAAEAASDSEGKNTPGAAELASEAEAAAEPASEAEAAAECAAGPAAEADAAAEADGAAKPQQEILPEAHASADAGADAKEAPAVSPAAAAEQSAAEAQAAESAEAEPAAAEAPAPADAAPQVPAAESPSAAAAAEAAAAPEEPQPTYSLPPGVTPEMARASAICIQSHARGLQARRQLAAKRKERDADREAAPAAASAGPSSPAPGQVAFELPPGVTPERAEAAAVRIQSHARGHLARRHVAELRRGREAGEQALATAVTAVAARKLEESYELPPGVTAEAAEAAAICVQAHMRGHLARRRVTRMRAERTAQPAPGEAKAERAPEPASAAAAEEQAPTEQGPAEEAGAEAGPAETAPAEGAPAAAEADTTLREEGETVSTGGPADEPAPPPPPPAVPEEPEEMTIDALKAALADDDDEEEEDGAEAGAAADASADGQLSDVAAASDSLPTETEAAPLDLSDPAAVAAASAAAAAAAKGAVMLLDDAGVYGGEGVADTTASVDQAAAEANMARLAATSARTSAMFQGAGAEMRYSDDEASALELMDNLDGLLQGDDEAAAAAAAVAAATAPADGEIVSISADGVSEPQSLGATASLGGGNPMDVTEPGGVRVLSGKYEVQHVVGEGAYGMVMKCKVRGTEPVQWVAIKEFKIDDSDPDAEDVKRTSLREVAVLEALQHPHVVGFVDKFMVGDRLFIVMEFLPCNLLELLEAQPGGMDRDAVRLIMFQLCSAIAFIHSKGMVYRDIKPENLLVDEHGTVKLCDFGFARYLPSRPDSHLTDYVATRWYRAPELLLGPPYRDAQGKHVQYMYGPQVDMWAVGCLMGELLDGEPLFAGDSDLDQLYRVQQILGPMAPTQQYMFYANPHNTGIVFNIKQPVTLGSRYRGKVSDVELSFMAGLLEMDPEKRLSGEACLQHPYLVDLAMAANTLPTLTPTESTTPTAPNMSLDGMQHDGLGSEVGGPASVKVSEAGGSDAASPKPPAAPPSPGAAPMRLSESREGFGSRGGMGLGMMEKAGSLTRAAGSLSRGGRSLSRMGSVSPVMAQAPVSSSPVPGAAPQRALSKLQASENGQVVIVEGVEEGDEDAGPVSSGMTTLKSISALPAVVSEIEPAEEA